MLFAQASQELQMWFTFGYKVSMSLLQFYDTQCIFACRVTFLKIVWHIELLEPDEINGLQLAKMKKYIPNMSLP